MYAEILITLNNGEYNNRTAFSDVPAPGTSVLENMKNACIRDVVCLKGEDIFKDAKITLYSDGTWKNNDDGSITIMTVLNPIWSMTFKMNPHKATLGAFDLMLETEEVYNDILWAQLRRPNF